MCTGSEGVALALCWTLRAEMMGKVAGPSGKQASLVTLLERLAGGMACSDRRDRVFALLGLASDANALGVEADYRKSYDEVLVDVTVRIIQQGNLYPLSVWTHKNLDAGQCLPTWVCRWPSVGEEQSLIFGGNAAGQMSADVRFSADRRCMHVSGTRVARILQPTLGFNFGLSRPLSVAELAQLVQLESVISTARTHLSTSIQHRSTADATLVHTILAGSVGLDIDSEGNQMMTAFLALVAMLRRHQQQLGEEDAKIELTTLIDSLPEDQKEHAYVIIRYEKTYGRVICFADCGRICLAPAQAQVGDIVAVFGSGHNLYVIRPAGNNYRYVGDAYMYGLMNGEAMEKDGWEKAIETFSLV